MATTTTTTADDRDPATPGAGPRPARRPRERGFALLLMMLLTSIAIVIVADLAYQSKLEHMAASNVSDLATIEYAVDGQFELALAMLKYDKKQNDVDSEYDEWNSKEKRSRTDETVQLTQRIFDECGKFPLQRLVTGNDAQQKLWKDRLRRLLVRFRPEPPRDDKGAVIGMDTGDADRVTDKLVEYLKREGATGQVPKPKTSTPGVPLLLDEIVFAEPKAFPRMLTDLQVKGKTYAGLHRYLTVYGPGKVNLNTAPLVVLEAFFDVNEADLAKAIVDRRNSTPEEGTETPSMSGSGSSSGTQDEEGAGGNPFTDPTQLTKVEGITVEILAKNGIEPANDFDVKSDFFGVWIQGATERTQRNELFIVERVKSDGFRHLLHQERTDVLLDLDEGEETLR